ncbi:protein disulfide isomerase-like 1-4 [Carex littledalei]|uniref:Protein disulfide-isomerase n=1 Tax=Carex littledalei TaxID=544730 RepID=A0A833VH12_9POAL|nr:protein disulfide isomerase-like 1-4 [Carex littledalei]
MASSRALFLALLTISALFLVNLVHCTDEDDDIAFLSQDDVEEVHPHLPQHDGFEFDTDPSESDSDLPQFDPDENEDDVAKFDESHVVVLTDGNFSSFITKNKYVMVEFYAPWCGHCKILAPEYAAAAKDLAEEGAEVALAKVDATEESDLSQKYDIQGFPTVLFFIDGVRLEYSGGRTRDTIVEWIKKKIGPGVHNITTVEEAEQILTSQDKILMGYLDSLVGADSDELSAASKLEDQVNFYQTVNADVAKLFHIDPKAKLPALVLLKKEEEKLTYFDGELSTSKIAEFVAANKLPLVTTFTQESAQSIFDNAIKNQVLLFTLSNETSDNLPVFQEAAKSFKGKLIFVSVEKDNEDVGEPVCAYFGVTGEGPQVIAFSGNEDQKKYFLKGELTVDNIKKFAEDFLEDRLQPFYKSEPIPETNDGDVKIVVGNNFDEIVLDESKDVLLEIYAPWCGHCEALEPIYNKLGKHLRGIDSLVIAKMDGTSNEHPRAQQDGFPTILFFPAGNKSFEPIVYDGERTVVEFYKFLKKHASIPFKLKKQHTSPSVTKSESTTEATATESKKADKDSKDEL